MDELNRAEPKEEEFRPWLRVSRERKMVVPKSPATPEERIAALEDTVNRLRNDVARLQSQRYRDDPAIEHAELERRRRETGMVIGFILIVVLVPLMLCNR